MSNKLSFKTKSIQLSKLLKGILFTIAAFLLVSNYASAQSNPHDIKVKAFASTEVNKKQQINNVQLKSNEEKEADKKTQHLRETKESAIILTQARNLINNTSPYKKGILEHHKELLHIAIDSRKLSAEEIKKAHDLIKQ